MTRTIYGLGMSMGLLLLAACTPAAEGVQNASQQLGEAKDDINVTMRELFTYKPRPRTPQPSSERYCYQFASDIVCYDAPQPQLRSKLVGVQGSEGARIISQPAPAEMVTPVYSYPTSAMVPGSPMDTSGTVASTTDPSMRIESHPLAAPFQPAKR